MIGRTPPATPPLDQTPIESAWREAMLAKAAVFKAQDAVSVGWLDATTAEQKELRKISKRLERVRAELEAIDRVVESAKQRGVR